MKNLISKEYGHMLWKDEGGDSFLLLKYAEVYQCSKNVLRLHVFLKKMLSPLRKLGLILSEIELDEPFTIVDVELTNLDQIIQLGAFKRRPNLKGKWIKDKEKLLAHKIIPLRSKKLKQ